MNASTDHAVAVESVEDQYPSTYDLPCIAGGQDEVLAILLGARRRFARLMTNDDYIAQNGAVCAVGAVAREIGITRRDYNNDYLDVEGVFSQVLEARQTDAAREAIKLLNESARTRFPESICARNWTYPWSGPLEWINQEFQPRAKAKAAVLECYDIAISNRGGTVL